MFHVSRKNPGSRATEYCLPFQQGERLMKRLQTVMGRELFEEAEHGNPFTAHASIDHLVGGVRVSVTLFLQRPE